MFRTEHLATGVTLVALLRLDRGTDRVTVAEQTIELTDPQGVVTVTLVLPEGALKLGGDYSLLVYTAPSATPVVRLNHYRVDVVDLVVLPGPTDSPKYLPVF